MGPSAADQSGLGETSQSLRLLPYGEAAVLAELPDLESVLRLYQQLGEPPAGIVDLVPAARTVLVIFSPELTARADIEHWLNTAWWRGADADHGLGSRPTSSEIRIPVRYDGPDLAATAEALRMSAKELIALHTGSTWTAAFTGFAPGFAYLVTDHERLQVPRRSSPRTAVPAGSVALAGEFSAVYPAASPGGWQLIGSTAAVLWDMSRQPSPALIVPGARVRFVEVEVEVEASEAEEDF